VTVQNVEDGSSEGASRQYDTVLKEGGLEGWTVGGLEDDISQACYRGLPGATMNTTAYLSLPSPEVMSPCIARDTQINPSASRVAPFPSSTAALSGSPHLSCHRTFVLTLCSKHALIILRHILCLRDFGALLINVVVLKLWFATPHSAQSCLKRYGV
jgi:hypothetical protein